MAKPIRRKITARRPAVLSRHTAKKVKVPKSPGIQTTETDVAKPEDDRLAPAKASVSAILSAGRKAAQAERDKPIYDARTGKVKWKGVEFDRSEVANLINTISRTPVSRGRFPTEADLIFNTYRNSPASPEANKAVERWRNNYIKAVEHMIEAVDYIEDEQNWRRIRTIVSRMSLDKFVDMMEQYGDELGIGFEYAVAGVPMMSDRLRTLWSSG